MKRSQVSPATSPNRRLCLQLDDRGYSEGSSASIELRTDPCRHVNDWVAVNPNAIHGYSAAATSRGLLTLVLMASIELECRISHRSRRDYHLGKLKIAYIRANALHLTVPKLVDTFPKHLE